MNKHLKASALFAAFLAFAVSFVSFFVLAPHDARVIAGTAICVVAGITGLAVVYGLCVMLVQGRSADKQAG